jgi:hypothetical protein
LGCKSEVKEVRMSLDINMDIYPVSLNETFSVRITRTLADGDSTAEPGEYNYRIEESSLYKEYEYIMFGRVFRTETVSSDL